jgi:hypothetical protein
MEGFGTARIGRRLGTAIDFGLEPSGQRVVGGVIGGGDPAGGIERVRSFRITFSQTSARSVGRVTSTASSASCAVGRR